MSFLPIMEVIFDMLKIVTTWYFLLYWQCMDLKECDLHLSTSKFPSYYFHVFSFCCYIKFNNVSSLLFTFVLISSHFYPPAVPLFFMHFFSAYRWFSLCLKNPLLHSSYYGFAGEKYPVSYFLKINLLCLHFLPLLLKNTFTSF